MYEEVEINTPLELARYLVNEGDLYEGATKTRLTVIEGSTHNTPFQAVTENERTQLNACWDTRMCTYYKKLNWYDCIPDGKKVPCYVSDKNLTPSKSDSMTHIKGYNSGDRSPYKGLYNVWKYATPIPANELWVPEL